MSLFPFINPPNENNQTKTLPLYREIAWNFSDNTPIVENGDFKVVEGNEAIKVWIYKAILTDRYEFAIYSWDYGSELRELLGKKYSNALTKEEAKRYIKEALLINDYILDVDVRNVKFTDDLLEIDLKVKSIYGESEVNFNV